jgi:hypothetical protein
VLCKPENTEKRRKNDKTDKEDSVVILEHKLMNLNPELPAY